MSTFSKLFGLDINGLPFVVIELKKPRVVARQAFDDNLSSEQFGVNSSKYVFSAFAENFIFDEKTG